MAVYKGGQKIEDLYCGSAKIGKIYKGSTLVYSSVKYYTFTINPTPSNATVKINNQTTKSVTVVEGTSISWSVSASGYTTQSGSLTLTTDTTKNVVLEEKNDPLYACYYGEIAYGMVGYHYIKFPLGSDMNVYVYETLNPKKVSSSSELKGKYSASLTSVNESTAVWVGSTWTRQTAGDLYS